MLSPTGEFTDKALMDLDDPTFKIQCVDECGGHFSGDSGVVESYADKTCKSLLAVPEGFAIEISFGSFDVSTNLRNGFSQSD